MAAGLTFKPKPEADVVCGQCGEPVTWARPNGPWSHVRTGAVACAPVCEVEGCEARAAGVLSSTLAGRRWVCDPHLREYRRFNPVWEHA